MLCRVDRNLERMDLAAAVAERPIAKPATRFLPWIYALFFVSGCPALIYQIVWQRSLFAIYGINIQSVTIVVTAFMLGLGLGSLAGGRISRLERLPALPIFGCVELCIGAYGLISLRLFHLVGTHTAGAPLLAVALLTFLLVLIPTMLMGGTLPFLVAYFVRFSRNVGASVGTLYFVNTLGSAFACLMCARFLMRLMGESGSVAVAAGLNTTVGSIALLVSLAASRRAPDGSEVAEENEAGSPATGGKFLPFPLALALVGVCGFISLSYEILWYRAYSFVSLARAPAFAYLLGAYLEGIAFGSLYSKAVCSRRVSNPDTYFRIMAWLVVGANLLGFLLIPIMARLVHYVDYLATLPLVALSAGLLGALFPLTTHLSVAPDGRAGSRMSQLYLCNIIGSAGGTALVGFVLMDIWGMRQLSIFLLVLGLALGAAVYAGTIRSGFGRAALVGGVGALAAAGVLAAGPLFDTVYQRMLFKTQYRAGYRFAHLLESKFGVVAVGPDGTVFGGGVYDGRFHTSLVNDTNMLLRAYAISAFHPAPREVLMVGLASGSWAQVIANNPSVDHLTIVEIDPDYLDLIPKYRVVASVLRNPKVSIEIDDGRRWLFRNGDRKFDVVVMNTTFNWRAHATNLLSVEFLDLIKRRLRPGGVFYYNTTYSEEALFTGVTQFPYALRVLNFLAVSERPLTVDKEAWRRTLVSYRLDGEPVFDLNRQLDRARLEEVLSTADSLGTTSGAGSAPMEYAPTIRVRCRGNRIITDDNMGTEWDLH